MTQMINLDFGLLGYARRAFWGIRLLDTEVSTKAPSNHCPF